MDELELLKKDWNTNQTEYNAYSDTDIYTMLHKKSSSIVKTLFYISIAELVFWVAINVIPYLLSGTFRAELEESFNNPLFLGLTIIGFAVILIFVYLLFKSYTSITTTDNVKKLMESILKTRKIVKYYVLYNLIMVVVMIPISFYLKYNDNVEFHQLIDSLDSSQLIGVIIGLVVATIVFFAIVWLFYRLIYGILLRRLNKNYNELKKLEV